MKGVKLYFDSVLSHPRNVALLLTIGYEVVAYNRTTSKVDHFLENEAKGEYPSSYAVYSH
jgi:6-phosphogluconate dehydrogenase